MKSGWTNQSLDTHTAWWRTDHEEHTGGITRTDFKAITPVAPHQTKEIHSPEKRQEIDRERRVEERKQEEGQQTDHGNQAVFCPLLFKRKCYSVILLFSLICAIHFFPISTLSQGQLTIFKSLKPPLFRVWGRLWRSISHHCWDQCSSWEANRQIPYDSSLSINNFHVFQLI